MCGYTIANVNCQLHVEDCNGAIDIFTNIESYSSNHITFSNGESYQKRITKTDILFPKDIISFAESFNALCVVGDGIGALPRYDSEALAIADGLVTGDYWIANEGNLDGKSDNGVFQIE